VNIESAKSIFQEGIELMLRKNKDYSGKIDNIELTGLQGVAVRLVDKVCRLYSLSDGREALVKDESIRDTCLDIENYANIAIQILDGVWGKKEC